MIDLASLADIQKKPAQGLDQALAKAPVGGREQNRSTIAAAMGLIKGQNNRTPLKIGKQYTLCRGKISQATVLLFSSPSGFCCILLRALFRLDYST
jgi:hypothetical protein